MSLPLLNRSKSPVRLVHERGFFTFSNTGPGTYPLDQHDLLEIPFRIVRVVAFGADGFNSDRAGLPGHAHEVAGVDVADLPDMHGLQVVGQEFHFR